MPRIGFILEAFYGDSIGGAERQVQLLARALQEHGWETYYICQRPIEKPRREIIGNMEVVALPPRKRRLAWLNYSALRRAMISCEAQIFYQRVRHPYTGLGTRIAHQLGKPFIFAAASIADVTRRQDLRSAHSAGTPIDKLLHPVNRYLEDWGMLHADHLILQTEDQLRLLKENYQRSGTVIPNHIVVKNDPLPASSTQKTVVWVSNIKPFKRPELFITLVRHCSDLEVDFVMIGSCPQADVLEMINTAQRTLPRFRYLGARSPEETEDVISRASLLVNTSEFEGFPNAFQQAWAHGVPTLSLGVDPDGVIKLRGMGAAVNTITDLENELRKLVTDEPERQRIGKRAIEYARQAYDLKILLPRYIDLLNQLL
ncbi:MAG: glycosyltransferase family 4 protein [bacterium]|nr:glycosyltransferase family 4 protein [bacterium]